VTAPVVLQPGAGEPLAAPAGEVTVKVATDRLTVLEFVCTPHSGPAVHRHHREDELWYVADGEFLFRAGGTRARTSRGGMALGPRGLPHAFRNVGDRPGRLLIVTTPGGIDGFFGDLARALADGPLALDALNEVGERHGIEFVGPPLVDLG
jgi:mannose-6-phosphate isomerase-like protein (cupin superfamily)